MRIDGPMRPRFSALAERIAGKRPGAPSRLRCALPGLIGHADLAKAAESGIQGLPGIRHVVASVKSGRVLVLMDPGCDAASVDAVIASLTRRSSRPSLRLRASLAWQRLVGSRERTRDASTDLSTITPLAWHAEDVVRVVQAFDVDPHMGLTAHEASVRQRIHGKNALAGVATRSRAEILRTQLFTVPVALLGTSIVVSALLGDYLEAGAIAIVVVANVAVGYVVEARAAALLDAWAPLRTEWAHVRRGGKSLLVRSSDVVPGDILELGGGRTVPADARIAEAVALTVDESMLTGESFASDKAPSPVASDAPLSDRRSMIYAGTTIAGGEGLAVVVATGARTELGALERSVATASKRKAPLERELNELGTKLAAFSVASAGIVALIGLMRGKSLREIARGAVALGVAAIPEGLPTAGTTALALASRRMFERGIVIRRLSAAETLGAMEFVCADKTGTLTRNRMRVTELYLPHEGALHVAWKDGEIAAIHGADLADIGLCRVREVARIVALNSDVDIDSDGSIGAATGTERALAELAMAAGYPVAGRRRAARRLVERRRTAERPYMVTVHAHPTLGRIALMKGAPHEVLDLCALTASAREAALRHNAAMASRGLRVLALAWSSDESNGAPIEGLRFAGLVGLHDPVRDGVSAALEKLGRAGITTLMLTGDQQATALAVARDLGIPGHRVHSRVTPTAKLDVVEALKKQGHIVGMTGDGVNDGPALEAADVGIAMGERGSDLARALADVVLVRDDLSSIAAAVEEGRRLYDNIRRAVDYLVATNVSEVIVAIAGSLFDRSPLGPIQLLWLNMLTDVAPALALTLEPPDHDIMDRPPRRRGARVLNRNAVLDLGQKAGSMAGASLASYAVGRARADGHTAASMAFVTLATSQILHALGYRASSRGHNPALVWAVGGAAAAQLLASATPTLGRALGIHKLSGPALATAFAIGLAPSVWQHLRVTDEDTIIAHGRPA